MSKTLKKLANDAMTILPKLAEQNTSVWKDLQNRPGTYFSNTINSPAVILGGGNVAYTTFIGSLNGLDVGPSTAIAIQSGVTLTTAARQIISTYNGESLAAPFRIQAAANMATASIFIGSAVADSLAGEFNSASMKVLPTITFASWGSAQWQIAGMLDRLAELHASGASENDIATDPLVQKMEKKYFALAGMADVVAPWKNMPINEVAHTLATTFTNPATLTKAQWGSVVSLPFFAAGLVKTFSKKALGRFLKKVEDTTTRPLPESTQKALGVQDGVTPNHYYSAGYAAGASFALFAEQPLFALAQGLWSGGYFRIAKPGGYPPESADSFVKKQRNPSNTTPSA